MKWGESLLLVIIIFILSFNFVFFSVERVNGYGTWAVNDSQFTFGKVANGNFYISNNNSNYSYVSSPLNTSNLNNFIGYVNVSISGSDGTNYNVKYSKDNSNYNNCVYGQTGYSTNGYQFIFVGVANAFVNGVSYVVKIEFYNAEFVTAYYDWVFNGSISLKLTYNGSSGWVSLSSATVSVKLTYNNDFNVSNGYGSATFALKSNNFIINSVDVVKWLAGSTYKMGIYNWKANKIDDYNYTISVNFVDVCDGSYNIDVWASGQNTNDGTLLSMEANTSFNLVGTSPITAGALLIVSPPDLFHIDLPSSGSTVSDITTDFVLEYGGNAINDFGPDGKFWVNLVEVKSGDATKINSGGFISNSEWVYNSATNTSMATFSYKWLNANNISDYDVVFNAYLSSKTGIHTIHSVNTIEIILGNPSSSSGNILIDFLRHLWEDFKKWFVDVMKYLFVPTNDQMQSIGFNGGLSEEMKSYLPFLDLSNYASDKVLFVKLSDLNNKYSDLYIDFSSSSLQSIFNFSRIAIDSIISILLLLLIYEVLK